MSSVAEKWYSIRHFSEDISLITEIHVASWLRCNIWHVKGKNRDILIDSGMGVRPLKEEVAELRQKDVICISSHCHFDHIGKISRKKSAELILQIIEDKKITNKKVIVMGDLNCGPDDEPMELLKVNLEDTYNSVGTVTYGPVGTFNQFNTEILLQKRIDYILVKNIEVKEYRHIDDRRKNNLFPSDHLPIQITFK